MNGSLYDKGFSDCLGYMAKRAILLGGKLLGFKGFCLFLATFLLVMGRIGEDVWLTLAVTLVCSASGIRVVDCLREGADVLDSKKVIAGRLAGCAAAKEMEYEEDRDLDDDGAGSGYAAAAGSGMVGGTGRAAGGVAAAGSGVGSGTGKAAGDAGATEAGRKAAARRARKAGKRAERGIGEFGRDRIRAALEEAAGLIG